MELLLIRKIALAMLPLHRFLTLLLLVVCWLTVVVECVPLVPLFHITSSGLSVGGPSAPFRDPNTSIVHLYLRGTARSGTLAGRDVWYHVCSTNYINWVRSSDEDVAVALSATEWYDAYGALSGTIMLDNNSVPILLYTCAGTDNVQRQCVASPVFQKSGRKSVRSSFLKSALNPVISAKVIPQLTEGGGNLHDPTEWWADPTQPGQWLVAFAASFAGAEGEATELVAFSTADRTLMNGYQYSHSLYAGQSSANDIFELPDFFRLEEQGSSNYFLKLSSRVTHRDYVVYGSYELNSSSGKYVFVEDTARSSSFVDFGSFYAAKSFFDPTLGIRRVWGWIDEQLVDPQANWTAVYSIRDVVYDETEAQLRFQPVPELKALRKDRLVSTTLVPIADGGVVSVLTHAAGVKKYQDIRVTFRGVPTALFDGSEATPSAPPEFGIRIRVGRDDSEYAVVSVKMPTVNLTATRGYSQSGYPFSEFQVDDNDDGVTACRDKCAASRRCEAWDVIVDIFGSRCVLYWKSVDLIHNCSSQTGRPNIALLSFDRRSYSSSAVASKLQGRAPLSSMHSATVELRVLVDDNVVEVYKDGGIQAVSGLLSVSSDNNNTGISLFAKNMQGSTLMADFEVFSMSSIWGSEGVDLVREYVDDLGTLLTPKHSHSKS